jgi:hypothetical protein
VAKTRRNWGDLNARLRELDDFMPEVDVIPDRQILDTTRNKHGDAFREFLIGGKLCVLNGRVPGENNFTCIKTQGKSVVDYFITHTDSIKYAKHMYVKTVKDILADIENIPTCTTPDHSVLVIDIDLSDYNVLCQDICKTKSNVTGNNTYSKQFKVNLVPENFMVEGPVVNDVIELVKDMSSMQLTQGSIDDIYNNFVDMHVNEMKRKLPAIEPKKKAYKTRQPFWCNELSDLFKAASAAEKAYCKAKGCDKQERRVEYKTKQLAFDKALKKAKNIHYRNTELELESMVGNNGREMWRKLDEIGGT